MGGVVEDATQRSDMAHGEGGREKRMKGFSHKYHLTILIHRAEVRSRSKALSLKSQWASSRSMCAETGVSRAVLAELCRFIAHMIVVF